MKNFLLKFAAKQNAILRLIFRLVGTPARIAETQVLKLLKGDKDMIKAVKLAQKEKRCLMWPQEMAQVYISAKAMTKLEGDFAEVGVFKGGSAKLICEVKGNNVLHLFDTFAGLPELTAIDGNTLRKGQFAVNLEDVKEYLGNYKNVKFYPGLFPQTAETIKDKRFAFVHLDVDLYDSTFEALKFFYPKMLGGGLYSLMITPWLWE